MGKSTGGLAGETERQWTQKPTESRKAKEEMDRKEELRVTLLFS